MNAVSYPDPTLNTTYTYDTGAFGKGRLTGITRHGEILAYTYDRFGRMLQDGTLSYNAAMIPPGMSYEIESLATDAEVSRQALRPEVALTAQVATTTSSAIPASASPHVHPAGR